MNSNRDIALIQINKSQEDDVWHREQAILIFNQINVNLLINHIVNKLELTIDYLEKISKKNSDDIRLLFQCSLFLVDLYWLGNEYKNQLRLYFKLHQYFFKLGLMEIAHYARQEREIYQRIYKYIESFGFEPINLLESHDFFKIAEMQIDELNPNDVDLRAFVLRAYTVKHLMHYFDQYKQGIKNNSTEYLSNLSQSKGEVDIPAVLAFSREYNISVVIIDSQTGEFCIIKRTNPAKTIFVGHETGYRFISLKQKIVNPIVTAEIINAKKDNFPENSFSKFNKQGQLVSHSLFYRTETLPAKPADDPRLMPLLQ